MVGNHHGLVFIDTLDQLAPGTDNLGILNLETEYTEGIFIINAHVHLTPRGAGKSVPALSPPSEPSNTLGSRIPVELSNVHVNGVLYTAGDLSYVGQPRLFGALVTGGKVVALPENSSPLELWYNYDLKSGLFRGLPVIYVARGTWQEKY
jgi:hypothetical protein